MRSKNGLIGFYHFLVIISTENKSFSLFSPYTAILSYDSEFCAIGFSSKYRQQRKSKDPVKKQ